MEWENWYLRFLLLIHLVTADLCPEPMIPNGVVTGEKEQDLFFGKVTCNLGYHLVGARNIKCRQGDWSQEELPVCSAIGACPSLPEIQNGRSVPIQGSRGSAFRFKCNRGYKRFGEQRTHCIGDRWSHTHMPSCAKSTCDVTGMLDIPYGMGRSMMGGAVYKYRCNPGVEMEGSSTLVCDGERWNGTIPDCNVIPSEPELEVIVSGNIVTNVKPGDLVLVNCQARGGHPLPDIGLTVEGLPLDSKDFRNIRNSFTFTASEKDPEKRILCSAVNKVGTSLASTRLHVHSPPKSATILGPKTIHHNSNFPYECSIEGGNPAPKISWTLRDHLGQTKKVKGEMIGSGLSRMLLRTEKEEKMMSIICLGENSQGIVSHTMHVNSHYLPKTVEISGPTTAAPGEYSHFTCLTTESFPVPSLKWRIEQYGDFYEVKDIDGDVSTEDFEDEGVMALAEIDILIEKGTTHALVYCSAVVEGLGHIQSKQHEVDVISIEDPVQILEEKRNEDSSEGLGRINYEQHEVDAISIKQPVPRENEDSSDQIQYYNHHKKNEIFHEHQKDGAEVAEKVSIEKRPEFKENEMNNIIWIPLKPDIEDYQNTFASEDYEVLEEASYEEDFLRPSYISEVTMLKQEKASRSAVVQSPVSVSMVYSSSSTISIHSIFLAVALSVSMLSY